MQTIATIITELLFLPKSLLTWSGFLNTPEIHAIVLDHSTLQILIRCSLLINCCNMFSRMIEIQFVSNIFHDLQGQRFPKMVLIVDSMYTCIQKKINVFDVHFFN